MSKKQALQELRAAGWPDVAAAIEECQRRWDAGERWHKGWRRPSVALRRDGRFVCRHFVVEGSPKVSCSSLLTRARPTPEGQSPND